MKILQLSAEKNWGGGGNHIENLCYELSKSNPEIENLIVIAEGGQFHRRLQKSNFFYETLPLLFKVDPRAIFKLVHLCKRKKFDLIHVHGSTSLTLAVIADKFYSLPPMVFSKKTSFPIRNRKQTLYKYNHPKLRKILCVSKVTEVITRKAIENHSKLQIIYHGTRIDGKSRETPFLLRKSLEIPSNYGIVGGIGNHITAKDLPTWIKTVDFIVNHQGVKNIRFVQIGSFSEITSSVRDLIEEKGLESYIHLLGFIPNASNFISQFDVLLVSSKSEGLPQVILEAFYHKIPVVSTNVGGIPEVIDDKYNGFLSQKEDPESLGCNVLKILNAPQLSKEFCNRSYKKLFPKFTSKNMAQETLNVYKEILKSG